MAIDKVYISGALMGAHDLNRVKELYNYIAEICIENGLFAYLPHNNTDPIKAAHASDDEVFEKDYREMISSSLVISYIGEPSLGVGAELSICVSQNIPIITLAESNKKVSRFVKGMLKTSENVINLEYNNSYDLKEKLNNSLRCFVTSSIIF